MLDPATAGRDHVDFCAWRCSTVVTSTTGFCRSINRSKICVPGAAVTLYALDAALLEGSVNTGKAVLVPTQIFGVLIGNPSGGVATAAVVRLGAIFFVGVVVGPITNEIIVLGVTRFVILFIEALGDDVAIFIHVAGLPLVTADDIGNIIPDIALRQWNRTILGNIALHQFVRMAGSLPFLVGAVVALCAFIGNGLSKSRTWYEENEYSQHQAG